MEAKDISIEQIAVVGAVIGGLYLIYQAVQGVKAAVPAVAKAGEALYHGAQAVTAPIAAPYGYLAAAIWKTWNWATSPNANPTGNVIMPNGTSIPTSQLQLSFNDTYNVAQFNYQGRAYVIPQNPDGPSYDDNGNYHAVTWDAYSASLSG